MKARTATNIVALTALALPLIAFTQSCHDLLGIVVILSSLFAYLRLVWVIVVNVIYEKDIEFLEQSIRRLTKENTYLLDELHTRPPKGIHHEDEAKLEKAEERAAEAGSSKTEM